MPNELIVAIIGLFTAALTLGGPIVALIFRRQLSGLGKAVDLLEQDNTRLRDEVKQLQTDKQGLGDQIDALRREHACAITALQQRLDDRAQQLERMAARLVELEALLAKTQQDKEALGGEVFALQREIADLHTEMDRLRAALAEREARIVELEASLVTYQVRLSHIEQSKQGQSSKEREG